MGFYFIFLFKEDKVKQLPCDSELNTYMHKYWSSALIGTTEAPLCENELDSEDEEEVNHSQGQEHFLKEISHVKVMQDIVA